MYGNTEYWQLICPLNKVNHLLRVIDLKDEAFDMMLHEGKYIRKPHHQQQTFLQQSSLFCLLYEIITVLDKQIEILKYYQIFRSPNVLSVDLIY